MKIKLGTLRHLIREAAGEKLQNYQGFTVGQWYKEKNGGLRSVGQLISLTVNKASATEEYVMPMMRYGGHNSGRRFEFWAPDMVPATPEEVEQAQAAWKEESDYMARHIDTSREGT